MVVAATAAVSYFGVLGDQAKETVDGRIDSIRDAAGALVPEGGFDCYNARSDEDIVQVISIDPPPGTVLEAGQIIDIAATVRYELDSHDTAEVELYYLLPPEREGDRYSGGSAGFAKREISGRGTVNLRGSFEVPDIPDTEIAVHLQPTLDDVRADGFDCWSSMDRAFAATYYVGDGSEIVEVREAQGSNETPGSVRRTVFTSLGGVNRAIAAVSDVVVASPELSEAEALFPGNGHYYQVVRRKDIGWEEARRAAERMVINGVRGHLATITSREETDWIAQNTDSGSGDLWIGGIQNSDNDSSDNDWRWVTGEKWSFTNWASGEPNDDPDDERFLEIDTTSGEWNDLNGVNGGFVVEFPFGDPVVAVQQLVPPQLRDDRFIECIVGLLGEERIREIAAAGNEPSEEEGRLIRLSCDETVAFQPNGEALVYNVAARIDGTSVLIIKGDDVQWFHANDAAPGRHDFANEPTFINGTEWMPEWPDEPDAENRDCQCYSSKLKEAIPELDLENTNVRIEVHQARGDVSFSEEDDDTLMVKFNDHPSGSDWYEISIIVEPGDGRQAVRRISNSGMRRGATVSGTVTDEDTGLPIAGISMRARPFHDDGPEPPDTETDSEGRYTLAGLSPGTYVIRARDFRRGYILEFFHDSPRADLGDPITVDVAEAIDGIDFELKLGAIVSGQVVDADTGEPINEAQIFASHTDGRGSAWTNTNSSGRYTLRGVPSGEVDIRAQAHGYIQEHVKLQVEGTERVTGTDFDLGIGASISGRVVDAETGQPVSRVYVFADTHSGNGGGNGSDTDFDGRYEISGLAPGTYYVKAEGDRHGYMRVYYGGAQDSNEAEPVRVEASSQVAGIDFQLEQGATIVGRVVDDQSGLPIVNIEVYAGPQNRGHSSWSRTDGNGEYILRGLPAGVMEVGARGLDYIERSLTVVTTDNQPATASDLRLEVGTTISGRVTDEATGRPIANVNIEANRDGGGSSSWANTDRDGRYVVRGIGPGTYRIQAQANEEGYVQEVYDDTFSWDDAREITIKSKEGVGGIDFALAMGVSISGKIVDAETGAPITNAEIYAGPQDGNQMSWTRTDGNGSYILKGLPVGVMEVGVRGQGYVEERLRVVTNDSQVTTAPDVRLDVGATISGRVTDEDTGLPIANVQIEANSDSGGYNSWANTDGEGRYVLRGVAPGTYRIKARADREGYIQELYDDTLNWDDARRISINGKAGVESIDFELAKGASISGTIIDAETGEPIPNMEVHAGPVNNSHLAWTRTDGQGNYLLRGLPDGRIEVYAYGQGYVEVSQTVTIQGGVDLTNIDF